MPGLVLLHSLPSVDTGVAAVLPIFCDDVLFRYKGGLVVPLAVQQLSIDE